MKCLVSCHRFIVDSFWGNPALIWRDGVHPTQNGASVICSNLANFIKCKMIWQTRFQARTQICSLTHLSTDPVEPSPTNINIHTVNHNNLIKINTTEETNRRIRRGLLNIRTPWCKFFLVHDLIIDHHIDLFCLTETWLQEEVYVSLNESTSTHVNYHIPCCIGREGGAIYCSNLLIKPKHKYGSSFESLTHLNWRTEKSVLFAVVYCPLQVRT